MTAKTPKGKPKKALLGQALPLADESALPSEVIGVAKRKPLLLFSGQANMVSLQYAAMLMGTNTTQARKLLAGSMAFVIEGAEAWTIESVLQCAVARAFVKGQEERPTISGNIDPESLEPKDRKDFWDSEKKRIEVEELKGQVVEVEAMRRLWGMAQKVITQSLLTLPDRMEVEASLTPFQVSAVEQIIDDVRMSMALQAQESLGYVPEP